MDKKIERIVENKYGYSHYITIYYTDYSFERINLNPPKPKKSKRK